MKDWINRWVPPLIVVGVGLWSVWPMIINPRLITSIGSDGWLITWILQQPVWGWTGNIFYPYQDTLAYSDMHKISALVSGGSFARAMVIGQVATLLVVYLWWKSWFKNGWAAAVGTVALGLSQIRWEYQVHLQMWSMQYWLLGLWLVGSWFTDSKRWKLYLGAILLGLQIYESPLPIYFALVVLIAWAILNSQIPNLKKVLFSLILFGIIVFPAVRVYGGVAREFGFRRDIREAAHNSISLDEVWGKFWSPGLVVLLAVALMRGRPTTQSKLLVAILVTSLVLALGPVLKWQGKTVKIFNTPIPLPYAGAYYLVPGWQGFRVPSRWLWLSAWAASGLIAAGLARRMGSDPIRLRLWAVLMVAVVGGTKLTQMTELPQRIPAVYRWLKEQPGRVVLELPVYPWPQEQKEVERMYYSLYHGKTLVNGSLYSP